MSANTPAAPAAPAKSKKMVIILAVVALLVVAGGAAAWFVLSSRQHAAEEGEEVGGKQAHAEAATPKTPPTFLPIENMVVNLADPGGDRFAQIGITLELADAKTETLVKQYLPSIRSGILMLVSQRTAEELLGREGKEKLAQDIRREVSKPLGFTVPKPRKARAPNPDDEEEGEAPRPRADTNPVRQVLFSSFIIQ
ncbi:flagellar basal body-associated FliL family protein [Paracidovorax wautersii]|uniref:Flagellar protein FliL n=1 Tax=Paracidovorax wautersii TaxID=1177982 RepID=A0ABU1ICH9_9BURK|nr:flagellar basal body-associated FliL family protein [Paracidovorax wautersii]MDR6214123.1 flagellar FliL protein [Paracidovorax wautersii]